MLVAIDAVVFIGVHEIGTVAAECLGAGIALLFEIKVAGQAGRVVDILGAALTIAMPVDIVAVFHQLLEIDLGLALLAAIVDNDDFEVGIVSLFKN